MTPDSFISSQRSFPCACVPTPAKTEKPPVHGNPVDHLHDHHRLARRRRRTARSSPRTWLQQVDDLDAGLEHLGLGTLVLETRGGAVDGTAPRPRSGPFHRPARRSRSSRAPASPSRPGRCQLPGVAVMPRLAVGGLHADAADQFRRVLLDLDLTHGPTGRFPSMTTQL